MRTKILDLTDKVRKMIDEGVGIIRLIVSSAPSVNVSKEGNEIGVATSYVQDLSKGVGTANYASLNKWLNDIQVRLFPSVEAMIAALNSKVVNELERTSALARSFNNLLAEVGAPIHFSRTEGSYAGLEVEPAIREYDQTISAVKEESVRLYDNYVTTTNSFNRLIDRAVGAPPVDPASLFEAHDYPGGMKLVVEEYWMNFHSRYNQELLTRLSSLKAAAAQLRPLVSPPAQEQLDAIVAALAGARPAQATMLLGQMEKLRALLRSAIDREVTKIEEARKLVASLAPAGELVLGLEFTPRLEVLRPLEARAEMTLLTFDDITGLMSLMSSTLAEARVQEKRDEEKLIVLAQYPVARKLIERMKRQSKSSLSAGDLPFEREASITFMRLYASGNTDAKFDSTDEVLVIRSAKMR